MNTATDSADYTDKFKCLRSVFVIKTTEISFKSVKI